AEPGEDRRDGSGQDLGPQRYVGQRAVRATAGCAEDEVVVERRVEDEREQPDGAELRGLAGQHIDDPPDPHEEPYLAPQAGLGHVRSVRPTAVEDRQTCMVAVTLALVEGSRGWYVSRMWPFSRQWTAPEPGQCR